MGVGSGPYSLLIKYYWATVKDYYQYYTHIICRNEAPDYIINRISED